MLIVALLDRPHRKSFGMVPFIARCNDGCLRAVGLVCGQNRTEVTEAQLQSLLRGGHIYDVSYIEANVSDEIISPVAGWLGRDFDKSAKTLSAPVPMISEERFFVGDFGSFWIQSSEEAYNNLLNWTEETAKLAILEKNAELADLMAWATPSAPETQAAIWYTRRTESEREKYLAWQNRVRARNSADILKECQEIIRQILGKDV